MPQIEKTLCEQLIKRGVSKKLALMIETLNEDIRKNGKIIRINGNSLCIYEKEKIIASVGSLDDKRAFVYDSRMFFEKGEVAVSVFAGIFLESYKELMTAFVPITGYENSGPSIPLPDFHSFKVSFDCRGEIVDIALLDRKMQIVAFASRIDSEA